MRISRISTEALLGRVVCAFAQSGRAAVAGTLCVLIAGQPVWAEAPTKRAVTAGQMQGDARVLHALNRLTFGPRPGDVAAVSAMGLNKWFEQQLNPASIDDSALDARLAMFPAMQLSQEELSRRFPSPQMIKQMAKANRPLPADPVEHAIYADEIAFYKIQQAKQAIPKAAGGDPAMAGGAAMAPPGGDMAGGDMSASTTPAPAAKARRRAQAANAPAPAATGDMPSGGDGMAGGAMADNAVLPKSALAEPAAPAEHVETLFRDLEAEKILSLPPDERMTKILAMSPKDLISFRQSLNGGENAELSQGLGPQQRETLQALQSGVRVVSSETLQSRMIRDIYSDRQLEAVMTDFWLNHFNVYVRKNQNEPYLLPAYERDTIRPNALGKFEDLLVATAKSPAMLLYLDNSQSVGPDSPAAKQGPPNAALAKNPQVKAALKDRGLNENYGRELMELHTLGVGGGYTQADVTMVAKVFTGWTAGGGRGVGGGYGNSGFSFNARTHEPGAKTVLGQTIPEGGEQEGLTVLHMLATSPATAKFLSTKLAIRFVSDDPPPALVDRMAKAYLASDGDIKVVLRTMFNSPEFFATAAMRSKVKTPLEFVVSAVRASDATVNNAQGLVQALDRLGMPLYGMQTPNGYSWLSEPWVSTGALVSRMNFALTMSGDKVGGTRTDWTRLLAIPANLAGEVKPVSLDTTQSTTAADPEAVTKERKLEMLLLGQPVSDRTRATVLSQSNDSTAAIQAAHDFQGTGAGIATYDPAPLRPGRGGKGRPDNAQGAASNDDRQAAVMAGLLLGSPEFQRR
jgi:uncharacterized protein (DUF1800 family)